MIVAQEPRWYEIAVMAGITLSDVNAPPKEWNSYLFPGQVPYTLHLASARSPARRHHVVALGCPASKSSLIETC